VGLGVVVLLSAPLAVIDCFGGSSASPQADASFDTGSGIDSSFAETGDDASSEAPAEAAVDSGVGADTSTPDVQDAQPGVEAEAGAPVVEVIAQGIIGPIALAVDPSFIYVLESATPNDDSGNTGGIRRCPIGGCGASAPTVVVPTASVPGGMALSGTTLFWSDAFQFILSCDVSTVPCTGTQFVDMLDDAGDVSAPTFPTQLWVLGSHLYWMVQYGSDRAIETCPVTGCSSGYPKTVMYAGAGATLSGSATAGLAVDGSYAYVSLFTGGPIYRYTMTSAETADITTETVLGSGSTTPWGAHDLDLDGTWLRWAESESADGGVGNRVAGCTAPGCNPVVDVATGRVYPYTVRHDATYIYGGDQGAAWNAGILWRLHK